MQQFWQTLVKEFTRTFITDNRWMVFWTGFKNTILITVVAALIGIAIGIVVSWYRWCIIWQTVLCTRKSAGASAIIS